MNNKNSNTNFAVAGLAGNGNDDSNGKNNHRVFMLNVFDFIYAIYVNNTLLTNGRIDLFSNSHFVLANNIGGNLGVSVEHVTLNQKNGLTKDWTWHDLDEIVSRMMMVDASNEQNDSKNDSKNNQQSNGSDSNPDNQADQKNAIISNTISTDMNRDDKATSQAEPVNQNPVNQNPVNSQGEAIVNTINPNQRVLLVKIDSDVAVFLNRTFIMMSNINEIDSPDTITPASLIAGNTASALNTIVEPISTEMLRSKGLPNDWEWAHLESCVDQYLALPIDQSMLSPVEAENDLILPVDQSTWLEVGNISVYVVPDANGVTVKLLPLNRECEEALNECHTFYSDAQDIIDQQEAIADDEHYSPAFSGIG